MKSLPAPGVTTLCNRQPEFIHSLFKPSGSRVSCCDIADILLTTGNLRPFKGKQSALQMTSSHQLSLLGHSSTAAVVCIFPCLFSFRFGCLSVCLYVFLNAIYARQKLPASFRSSCKSHLCPENRSRPHQTPVSHSGITWTRLSQLPRSWCLEDFTRSMKKPQHQRL